MRNLTRTYLALIATLALLAGAWASVVLPVHGAPGFGLSEMVLCADGAEQTILVDAHGNPAEKSDVCHHCPDCLPSVAAALASFRHDYLRPVTASVAAPSFTSLESEASLPRWHPARAPPLKA